MAKKVDTLEKLTADLEREFRSWDTYYNFGGSDPFHEDGVNLTLIRNHIIYYKKKIEEEISNIDGQLSLEEKKYPDIYYKETPPEVDYKYMATPNKILDTGITFVRKLEENESYQYILKYIDQVFPKQQETEVTKALGISFIPTMQLKNYRDLIESGNLIAIRRTFYKKDFDKFIKELEITAEKFEKFLALTPEEIERMSEKKKKRHNYVQEDSISENEYEGDMPRINAITSEEGKTSSDYNEKKNEKYIEYERE